MSTPDDRAREAANRLQDDVLASVDLDTALTRSRRARRPTGALVAIAAAMALLGAVAVLRPDSGDVEVAIDEDGLTTTIPEDAAPPDFDKAPAPIALGAPDDGKESIGLPVIVEPATGLVDGQTVTASGQGFPPNESVGVVMCAREAGRDHGARGVEACNIGHFAQGTSDGQGNVSVEFTVRRLATLDGQEVDCASEPGRCIVGMGLLSDYDQSGGFAIDFDPSLPLPDPPTVELTQTEDLTDGQEVGVRITGLVPNGVVFLSQCASDGSCAENGIYAEGDVDASGTYEGTVRVWRSFGGYGPAGPTNVDCLAQTCQITFGGDVPAGRQIPPITISFDPSTPSRQIPTLTLLDEGPFSAGDRIRVRVGSIASTDTVDLSICRPDGECVGFGGARSEGASAIVEIRVDGPAGSCGTECLVSGFVYPKSYGEGATAGSPPPLSPEPISVTITG